MPRVISSEYLGKQQTYDLELDDQDHQFYLTNGLLTSNSHAASYAVCSVQCANLLTYHQDEWVCSYVESMIGDPDKRAKAISEARSLGYKIGSIDVNKSSNEWTVDSKTLVPSLLTVKGIGNAAVMEIMKNRPYHSFDELLWTPDHLWRHSKFNKLAFNALICVRAFDSLKITGENKLFESYKHMHRVVIDHWNLLKKRMPQIEIEKLINETRCTEWSRHEIIKNMTSLVGDVNIRSLIDNEIIDVIEDSGALSIDSESLLEMNKALTWFFITNVTSKVSKNGKMYLVLESVGETGEKKNIFCWGAKPEHLPQLYSLFVAEISIDDFGFSTSVYKLREVSSG